MSIKKDYIREWNLRKMIIREYRSGRTVKSLTREFSNYSIDESGGALPKGYVEQVIYQDVMQNGFA